MRPALVVVLALGICALTVGGAIAALPEGGSFADDDGSIHEGSIEAIAAAGITAGCNPPANTLFCPSSSVTRGQMAAFLTRALGLTERLDDRFVDDDSSVFEADIERLAAAGISAGCNPPDNDRFCPDDEVTRGEMAAFLVRAFGYSDNGDGDLFIDDDRNIFEDDIDRLGKAGVTKGCNPSTNDRYCPENPVRRDELASFLARALGLSPIFPPPRVSTFGDGVWIVGLDIAPGTYRTEALPGGYCTGERLSGFSGEPGDVIARDKEYFPLIVTIEATDAGFSSENCGLWTDDTTPRRTSPTAPLSQGSSEGYWVVGDEVAPGLWFNKPGEWCSWRRLSGFSWELHDTIGGGLPYDPSTIRIEAADKGFYIGEFCGSWTYLGP